MFAGHDEEPATVVDLKGPLRFRAWPLRLAHNFRLLRISPLRAPSRNSSTASRTVLRAFLEADDGVRTRDPQLGKLMLYQLSYVRKAPSLAAVLEPVAPRMPGTSLRPQGVSRPRRIWPP